MDKYTTGNYYLHLSLRCCSSISNKHKGTHHTCYCYLYIVVSIIFRSGTLHPPNNEPRQYGQIYILEAGEAVEHRMQQNENCQRSIMEILHRILIQNNPFAMAFRQMFEIETEEHARAGEAGQSPSAVTMHFRRGRDQKRYNLPSHDEVAVIFSGEDGAPPAAIDITIYPRDRPCCRISHMSANCDPMVYPLLFPRGDLGWHPDMQHTEERCTPKQKRVTLLQFYSYRLAIREEFSAIHRGGKLFQQYLVDAYVKTESNNLQYIRMNQKKLRVELYQGLMDHLNDAAVDRNLTPGKIVVLPSSFSGSPRAMAQNFQDAMAVVSKYGKPDLFLTYTCNPRCREITENLLPGQRPEDRPDLVARVYKRHLTEIMTDIRERHVLGIPVAWMSVIEYQKRGLPHLHVLIILRAEDKLRTPEDIDTCISAEIPNPDEDPELHEIVKSHMVHGPCGLQNPNSPCMKDGKCSKGYPKEFSESTCLAENGYPAYKRPNNDRTMQVGCHQVDNR